MNFPLIKDKSEEDYSTKIFDALIKPTEKDVFIVRKDSEANRKAESRKNSRKVKIFKSENAVLWSELKLKKVYGIRVCLCVCTKGSR